MQPCYVFMENVPLIDNLLAGCLAAPASRPTERVQSDDPAEV